MHSANARVTRPIRTKLLALGVGLVLALVAVEVGTRIVLRLRGTPFDSAAAQGELTRLVEKMNESLRTQGEGQLPGHPMDSPDSKVVLHPYLGLDWSHYIDAMPTEMQYFRSAEHEGDTSVLVVGGSVAAHFGSTGWEAFVKALAESPHFNRRPVRIFSHGRGAFKQPQQMIDVAYCLSAGYKPDIVLNLDGFNECAIPSLNIIDHASPLYPSIPHWAHMTTNPARDLAALDALVAMRSAQAAAQRALDSAVRKRLFHSALISQLVRRQILELQLAYTASYGSYTEHSVAAGGTTVSGPTPPEDWEQGMALALVNWKESSRSIAALCRERGIMYLHVLQPTLHDAGSKPLTAKEVETSSAHPMWIRGVVYGYSKLRDLGAELKHEGVAFLDASLVFKDVTQPLYYDLCHFTTEGNDILGRVIAKELIAMADARAAAGGDAVGADADAARAAEQARLRAARLERAEQRKQKAKENRDKKPPEADGGGG